MYCAVSGFSDTNRKLLGIMAYEVILADHLEWKVIEGGSMVEINSEQFDFVIDPNDTLLVYLAGSDGLYAERKCVDLDHAQFIAKAFEIMAIRNAKRGCDWHGRPWPPKSGIKQ